MVDQVSRTPGLLTLHITNPSESVETALDIPIQTMRLRSYRVEFDTAANALAAQVIYVELPITSRNQLIDNNVGHVYFPILIGQNIITLETSLNIPLYMSDRLPEKFLVNVRDGPGSGFALVSNMVSLTLQFELSEGHLT